MIEELNEYLIRHHWSEDIADDAATAYGDAPFNAWREPVTQAMKWMDDDEHDYTGELCDHIQAWRIEVGEDHNCSGWLPYANCGRAIEYCVELDGELWAGNGEYDSQVAFCPFCGHEAQVKPKVDIDNPPGVPESFVMPE